MTQTFTGRRRVRRFFGSIREVAEMPNLIEVQKASYDQFLLVEEPEGGRPDEGLQAVFKSVFPISDFSNTALLEFVRYDFDPPKYDVDECRQRGMTYSAPLKVTLRLIVFDVDEETGAKSVKDIKEQEVYMGEMPLMTNNGTFIVNGTERVIVSQMHRSPGVFFDHDKGKTHSIGQAPVRGAHHSLSRLLARHRVRRQGHRPRAHRPPPQDPDHLAALCPRPGRREDPQHLLQHGSPTPRPRTAGACRSTPQRMRGFKANADLIDADSGEVVIEAGHKLTARGARQLAEKGIKALKVGDEDLYGLYLADEMVNPETGEIYAEAGDEITEKLLKALLEAGYDEIAVLDIDHVNTGAYIRNTLAVDKNETREERALRHLPGHASRRAADRRDGGGDVPVAVLRSRALRPLGGRPGQDEHAARPRRPTTRVRVLRKDDILAVIKTLVALRDGKGEIDDIDNLGNRRVRSVGELMENQYRIGLLRMERAIKERMSSVEIGNVMPQDLINAKPAAAAVREFFGSSQLSQFMDQTNPLSEITHKRRLSALGPGGLTRERAGFEVRDVHPTHYGRICPIETPEGPNIGLINSLATFARVNKYGFIESPYRRVKDGRVTEEVVYLSAMEEAKYTVAQANSLLDAKGKFTEDLITCRHAGDVTSWCRRTAST